MWTLSTTDPFLFLSLPLVQSLLQFWRTPNTTTDDDKDDDDGEEEEEEEKKKEEEEEEEDLYSALPKICS